ncbi:MAG: hypothetical protein LC808_07210 [Actinobacteria bacterium]|nr:hypothetical protein [Actinomycetota bacterium]
MGPPEDPGWRSTWRYSLCVFMPGWSLRLRTKAKIGDGLIILRGVLVSCVVLLVLVGIPIVLLGGPYPGTGELSEATAALVVVLIGTAGVVVPRRTARALNDDDDAQLARSYGKRFLRGVGLAQLNLLAGILGFVITGARWMYLLGAAFTAIRLWQLAPTGAHLREDQAKLQASNSPRSLISALRSGNPFGGG